MEPEKTSVTPEVTPETKPEETAEYWKAKAEEAEQTLKDKKAQAESNELVENQKRRFEKAQDKIANLNGEPKPTETPTVEVDVEDLLTLRLNNIQKDSDKAKILDKYKKGGLVDSYESALTHPGVKAELDALDAKNTAETVIDESDKNSEGYTKTKKELVHQYQNGGVIPEDPKAQGIIVEENLKQMGL